MKKYQYLMLLAAMLFAFFMNVSAEMVGTHDYAEADLVVVTTDVANGEQLANIYVSVSGSVTYRKAPLAGVEVKLTHDGDEPMTVVSDENGKFVFDKVTPAQSYTLTATKEGFRSYESRTPIVVETLDVEVPMISLYKPMAKVTGYVMDGDIPMVDAKYLFSSKNTTYGTKLSGSLGDDGKLFAALPQDVNYMLTIMKDGYETYSLADSVSFGAEYDFGIIQLKPLMVKVVVDGSDYVAYSSDKALDYSSAEGLKAYIVSGVTAKNNAAYVSLKEVDQVPAMTGVLLKAAAGEYSVSMAVDAATIKNNLLVATGDQPFSGSNMKNKIWTLGKDDRNVIAFTSADDITVQANSAYLNYELGVEYIYLDENSVPNVDGINDISYDKIETNTPVYNLSGQRVGKDYKGLVIQNGKKYLK